MNNQPLAAPFAGLEPAPLWQAFAMICQTPRCSGDEGRIRERVLAFASQKGLKTRQDEVGNVVLLVPAAGGCEDWPTVVLQGHLDMVCERTRRSTHDFTRDPLRVERDGDWLVAPETTLGADNGIALAAALALLDDAPPRHGPLELLFTVDEERGLTGATQIGPHMIEGTVLLNLDSEEEGFITVGCAGGGDTLLELPLSRAEVPSRWALARLVIDGGSGGHSGIDIHRNRANALRCLGRAADALGRALGGLRLAAVEGGSKRNAIPRDASALVAFPADDPQLVEDVCSKLEAELASEFGSSDPELTVRLEEADAPSDGCYDESTTRRALALLLATPSGVLAMNRELPDAVETSTNLGVASEHDDRLRLVCCTRSSLASALEAARLGLRALGELAGAAVIQEAAYPGWAPDLSSRTAAIFKEVHAELFGKPPEVMVIHAGLECGILGERFSGLDMISFGPTMLGVHAPGEKLSISSTQRFFTLLKALLGALGPA